MGFAIEERECEEFIRKYVGFLLGVGILMMMMGCVCFFSIRVLPAYNVITNCLVCVSVASCTVACMFVAQSIILWKSCSVWCEVDSWRTGRKVSGIELK